MAGEVPRPPDEAVSWVAEQIANDPDYRRAEGSAQAEARKSWRPVEARW